MIGDVKPETWAIFRGASASDALVLSKAKEMLALLEEIAAADDIAIAQLDLLGIPPDSKAFDLTQRIKALIAATKGQ